MWIALPIILSVAGLLYAFDNKASDEATSDKPKVWSNEECLSCHVNERVLKQMQSKRGDPTYCQAAYDKLIREQGGKDSAYPVKK